MTPFKPSQAVAGYFGGLSSNLGGQMLTVTADVGYKERDVELNGGRDDFTSRSFIIKTTYGLADGLDIFFNVGFADIQDINNFTGALGTLYGGGFKFLLFGRSGEDTNVSITGNIETFKSQDSGTEAEFLDYSVAAVVSNKSGNFIPFGGITYSDAEIEFEGGPEYEADKHVGLLGGADYFVNPNVYFTGEFHIFDENAVYLGVGYNF